MLVFSTIHIIFIIIILQYHFDLWVDLSFTGWNPKVTLLLAGLVKHFVDDGKDLCCWRNGVKTNFVYHSVGENLTRSVNVQPNKTICLFLIQCDPIRPHVNSLFLLFKSSTYVGGLKHSRRKNKRTIRTISWQAPPSQQATDGLYALVKFLLA